MRAVFLDRDGVINEDRDDYVKNVDELHVYPYSPNAIKTLNDAGMQVFVVSNQQGIAKGIFSDSDLNEMVRKINSHIERVGGKISEYYFCKHLASDNCSCRKPKTGLLLKAAKEHKIELQNSFMVGDSERDIIAGKNAGCKTILVLTGKISNSMAAGLSCKPDYVAPNLLDAANIIVKLTTNK